MKDPRKFITSFALTFATAMAGSAVTLPAITTWYQSINKPFFNPPNSVFGPVWTVLYIFMAYALYLVWTTKKDAPRQQRHALRFFFVQLAVNFLWSVAFFGFREPVFGFIIIIILWVLILETIRAFRRLSKEASYLLYPYLAWVSFATILNFAIVLLNY